MLEYEKDKMKSNETSLKEQIELKEKDIIQLQIKLKEMKSLNNGSNLYNTNNYRSKSNLSKSNSSINIYKDNLTENKDNNINYFNNNINNVNLFNKKNSNSLYNNIHMANKIKKIKRNNKSNHNNITLSNSTISLQNFRKVSSSKSKNKRKYNNSINYFNKKYINNLTTIFLLKEPKNKKKSKNSSKKSSNNNINLNNKSMLELFPSRNLSYLINNNKFNIYNYNINNSNKKKNLDNSKSKSLNITHNTINMNKNNVMINLNANIINTNTPIEKYKVQQKLIEYKKYINKKLNEFSKNKKKVRNTQIFPPTNKNQNQIKLNNRKKDVFSTCAVHYKRINKYLKKNNNQRISDKNKRKISPYQNQFAKNIKFNFNSNSSNKIITLKKNSNNEYGTNKIPNRIGSNIIINNTNNNIASRSSSNNSKSSLNVVKNRNIKKFSQKPTLKNFVFTKS